MAEHITIDYEECLGTYSGTICQMHRFLCQCAHLEGTPVPDGSDLPPLKSAKCIMVIREVHILTTLYLMSMPSLSSGQATFQAQATISGWCGPPWHEMLIRLSATNQPNLPSRQAAHFYTGLPKIAFRQNS